MKKFGKELQQNLVAEECIFSCNEKGRIAAAIRPKNEKLWKIVLTEMSRKIYWNQSTGVATRVRTRVEFYYDKKVGIIKGKYILEFLSSKVKSRLKDDKTYEMKPIDENLSMEERVAAVNLVLNGIVKDMKQFNVLFEIEKKNAELEEKNRIRRLKVASQEDKIIDYDKVTKEVNEKQVKTQETVEPKDEVKAEVKEFEPQENNIQKINKEPEEPAEVKTNSESDMNKIREIARELSQKPEIQDEKEEIDKDVQKKIDEAQDEQAAALEAQPGDNSRRNKRQQIQKTISQRAKDMLTQDGK
jgi:hypothetical protein